MFKSSWFWWGSLTSCVLLLVALGSGLINQNTWIGAEWEWSEEPLDTLQTDEALVCLQPDNAPQGSLSLAVVTPAGERWMAFWDNHHGRCAKIPLEQVGQLRLMPQRQHLFLSQASLTTWDNGWVTHLLQPERGGWWVR
jgi:hypothetical protein